MGGHGHDDHDEMAGSATEAEMVANNIHLAFRDSCAHLLIDLNKCRSQTHSMPWECNHQRHIYEKCQYLE